MAHIRREEGQFLVDVCPFTVPAEESVDRKGVAKGMDSRRHIEDAVDEPTPAIELELVEDSPEAPAEVWWQMSFAFQA